ncbi:MAG: DUF971 domain-containing protein [Planctomycetota bacterium]
MDSLQPASIDLKKDRGLTIEWHDGSASYYSIAYLRKMSPSADMRQLREEMAKNPLAVLPDAPAGEAVVAVDAELVGNYAIRIRFSDGHSTGIYSWAYLRDIDPANQEPNDGPNG